MKTEIVRAMIKYFQGDPRRVNHFMKVYGFAQLIAEGEKVDQATKDLIETSAIVHDIGIKVSEIKYKSASGKYQELEGPLEARKLLEGLKVEDAVIERTCWLIGHHHTYNAIEDIDHQILVEADFLVNIYEDQMSKESIKSVKDKIFRTQTGKDLLEDLFLN